MTDTVRDSSGQGARHDEDQVAVCRSCWHFRVDPVKCGSRPVLIFKQICQLDFTLLQKRADNGGA
jgi:hypothetical protein